MGLAAGNSLLAMRNEDLIAVYAKKKSKGKRPEMLLKVAWRNIWRSKIRTIVVIGAVIVGIWSLIFLMSFVEGMVYSYINGAIENETSHIQIHEPDYKQERELKYLIPNAAALTSKLESDSAIGSVSSRILVNGMAASAKSVRGVTLKGIEPEKEKALTHLDQKIIEGSFFDSKARNPIVISQKLAENLKVGLRSKVIVNFQDLNTDITASAFRVVGIYKTSNQKLDEITAFANYEDLRRLTGLNEGASHEIALRVRDFDRIDFESDRLKAELSPLLVESYKEISPDLELFNSQIKINLIIMTTIVMLALIFGIINTMLMAVLERVKELGMLMAIGMNKAKVFTMIVLETILVSTVGAPIGLLLGYWTVRYLNQRGIDLSQWSAGLEKFGFNNMIRPTLGTDAFVTIAVAIVITAVLGSIYPSLKAIRLKPVEALRKI